MDTENAPPFIDEEIITNMKELGNGDGDFSERLLIVQLMCLYLDNLPERMLELNTAMDQQDIKVVERGAHTLKSSSRLIGLLSLSLDCQILEDMACQNEMNDAKDVHNKIKNTVKMVPEVIKNKVKELET